MAPPRSSAKRRAVQQQQEQDDVQDAANDGGGYFSELAKKHWLNKNNMNTSRTKVKQDVIKKDIWDILEKDSFSSSSLLSLESLQLLEKYVAFR